MPWPSVRFPSSSSDPAHAGGSGGGAVHGDAVLAGYRLIRRLATGDRADVFLARARVDAVTGTDLVVVRTYGPAADEEAIARELAAMHHDGAGATPALLDVATLGGGRCCLVVERIGGEPLASVLAPGGLLPGQAVTALAPMVIAVRELAARGLVHTRLDVADVVLDDEGRPRLLGLGALAPLDGGDAVGGRVERLRQGYGALLRLIEAVAAATRDARALDPVVDVVRSTLDARPFLPPDELLERALFAVATPLPLPGVRPERVPRAEVPSRVLAAGGHDVAGAAAETAGGHGGSAPDGGRPRRWARLAELAQFPAGVAVDVADTLDRDPRAELTGQLGGMLRRRRGALVTGGFVGSAALVALLTAVPPSGAESDVEGDAVVVADAAEAASDQHPSPSPAAPTGAEVDTSATIADDPVAAAAALLEIRTSCLASLDVACLAAVAQPGSPIEARDRAAIVQGDVALASEPDLDAITVVADLGDAVVVSVPDVAGERDPASLLMMRSEAGWRLREWFD